MNEKDNTFTLVAEDFENDTDAEFRLYYEKYADRDKYAGCYKIHGPDDVIPFGSHGETTVGEQLEMSGNDFLEWCIRNVDWFLLEQEVLDSINPTDYEILEEFYDYSEEEKAKHRAENAKLRDDLKQFHSEKLAKLKASGARELTA